MAETTAGTTGCFPVPTATVARRDEERALRLDEHGKTTDVSQVRWRSIARVWRASPSFCFHAAGATRVRYQPTDNLEVVKQGRNVTRVMPDTDHLDHGSCRAIEDGEREVDERQAPQVPQIRVSRWPRAADLTREGMTCASLKARRGAKAMERSRQRYSASGVEARGRSLRGDQGGPGTSPELRRGVPPAHPPRGRK